MYSFDDDVITMTVNICCFDSDRVEPRRCATICCIWDMLLSGKSSERQADGGQTTQKANIYLGDFWTSQPEQVVTFSLMTYH